MLQILRTATFDRWLGRLRDRRARARILVRIDRLAVGNPGDAKSVGDGVYELKIDHGPGYRVYYTQRGTKFILLVCGGDKSTQTQDISTAKRIAAEWRSDSDNH